MILLYHKVYPETPTGWWVYVDEFYRQMSELRCKKVVYLDEYDPNSQEHVVISFDGVYDNIVKYAAPILKHFNYPYELFVVGDLIGKDNSFEKDEPLSNFANEQQLRELVSMGGRLQWHSRSHINLKEENNEKVIRNELTIPEKLKKLDKKGFKWFGYPHGEYSEIALDCVKKNFDGALSVIQGDDSDKYKFNRQIVNSETSFRKNTIGVIIPSYNYGHFLIDAVESVLRQTVKPDKILISDDCSTDDTQEIGNYYASKHPNLVTFNRNKKNMGIVKHFRKVVKIINTDYVCFLGADNRMRSDFIEKCAEALDSKEDIGIAYTDLAIFGDRASEVYLGAPEKWRGKVKGNAYLIHYPEFNSISKKQMVKENFMHGSSMYKMRAYMESGGYRNEQQYPEDHSLFLRMVKKGWNAKRVPYPILEYRQHSIGQANTALGLVAQLTLYKNENKTLRSAAQELDAIKRSKFWKLLDIYKNPRTAVPHYTKRIAEKILERVSKKIIDK